MTNDEILNTFANKMLTAVEGIEAFGKEQIPDYIEQVLTYNFWEGIFFIVVPVLIFLFFIKKSKKLNYKDAEYDCCGTPNNKESASIVATWIFVAITGIWSLVALLSLSSDVLKIKVAPKVYIVDYLRDSIK